MYSFRKILGFFPVFSYADFWSRHGIVLICLLFIRSVGAESLPKSALSFLDNYCLSCHDSVEQKGDFDMESLGFDLADPDVFSTWIKIHDRADHGEMPPKKKERPHPRDLERFLKSIGGPMVKEDQRRYKTTGRAPVRRLNRFEFENSLRDALNAPWLQVADQLPEDGIAHFYNKIGSHLDVYPGQMARYFETAEYAVRVAMNAAAYPSETKKFYARDEPRMQHYLFFLAKRSGIRAFVPLSGLTAQPDVIRGIEPVTVGDADPELREQEAVGIFTRAQSSESRYAFNNMDLPIDGRYKLRIKSYSFRAGLNGANINDDHGLTGGDRRWWRPNRNVAYRGIRSEPVTLYSLDQSGNARWLATYDALPEPTVVECVVDLKKGEDIRPSASRLMNPMSGWIVNPNATPDGIPGFALNWLEVEGPLVDSWPPPSYTALFGDMPFEVGERSQVKVISENPEADANRLLRDFAKRVYHRSSFSTKEVEPFFSLFKKGLGLGYSFSEAMVGAFASILCSSEFLFLESLSGKLSDPALAARLSYFLWNGPPDDDLRNQKYLSRNSNLRKQTERMLNDPRSERFLNAFLDYWLDLREIDLTTPDANLYGDYFMEDLLTESSVRETRLFFRELVDQDLPAINLIDSDFTYLNERLARHYDLPAFESIELRQVELPDDSVRGGLLTQASILRITANGTTTSPVVRGAWVSERLLGVEIPPPPSGIDNVEPDTRGATTIREQLNKHRDIQSCNACHAKFDPVGFALESFDVGGGWQSHYRAVNDETDPVIGFKNSGDPLAFHYAKPVDCSGQLMDGREFSDVNDLKRLLTADERAIARNLVNQFIVYSTGAPVSFGDRPEVEKILHRCEKSRFGVRSLLDAVIQSELFKIK